MADQPDTTEVEALREHVRRLAIEAQVATARHPNCGALGSLNYALHALPPQLRPARVDLPPHPEDDKDDRTAEMARLRRELREAREQLVVRPVQTELFEVPA